MDEISDSPLWDRSPGGCGLIPLEDLELTVHLRKQLHAWNALRHSWPPEGPSPWSRDQWTAWRQEGVKLAHYLQNELWDVDVFYVDEAGHHVAVKLPS